MGWSSCASWRSPKDILREVSAPTFWNAGTKIIRTMITNYGRHIWMAVERESGERFIAFFLIEGKAPNLAYKSMSEDVGPAYHDCPLALLDMVPEPTKGYAMVWRAAVRQFHAKRNEKFEVGQSVTVYGKSYKVKGMHKRSYLIESPEGRVYKCSATKMNRVATNV